MIGIVVLYFGLLMIGYSTIKFYDIYRMYNEILARQEPKEKPVLTDSELLIGYSKDNKKPLIIDMNKTPHLFICGLSGNGKTRMIEYAIKNKNVILINAMEKDFKSCKRARRIIGNENILEYFNKITENIYVRKKPLFLVIDELLVLCMDKKITEKISNLLAIGRHYNIYIIGISQIGTKEAVKFKDLFNSRVCFRQVEESSYRTVLGYSPEYTDLQKREFHLYSDQLAMGITYDIRPDE